MLLVNHHELFIYWISQPVYFDGFSPWTLINLLPYIMYLIINY